MITADNHIIYGRPRDVDGVQWQRKKVRPVKLYGNAASCQGPGTTHRLILAEKRASHSGDIM